jgi:hypothetical protein
MSMINGPSSSSRRHAGAGDTLVRPAPPTAATGSPLAAFMRRWFIILTGHPGR